MPLGASIRIESVPKSLKQGDEFDATFSVQNTGSVAFVPGTHKLGAQSPQDTARWGDSRVNLQGGIAPGQTALVQGRLRAMEAGAAVPFAWQMLQEGYAWFGPTASLQVEVVPGPPPPNVWPGRRKDPMDVVNKEIFNTGPYPFSRDLHVGEVVNDSGETLFVTSIEIWTGVDKGAQCDSDCELFRKSDGSAFCKNGEDHYLDGERVREKNHNPYMAIEPGDSFILRYFSVVAGNNGHAHHIVNIWWRYQP